MQREVRDRESVEHDPEFHVPSGEVESLDATGTPIGLLPASNYTTGSTQMESGDLLVLYTDGINEAEDPSQEQYGVDRLAEVCRGSSGLALDELAAAIEEDLLRFADGVPFADDRTTVLIRRTPS